MKTMIPKLATISVILFIPLLINSCDSDDGGASDGSSAGGGLVDAPNDQDPVVTLPITAADVPNLKLLYLGKTREQAFAISAAQKHDLRIVSIDGEGLPVTEDFVIGRINVSLENNIITSIDVEIPYQEPIYPSLPPYEGPLTAEEVAQLKLQFAGLTLEEAKKQAYEKGHHFRITSLDGEEQIVTLDFVHGRINATVVAGRIVSIEIEVAIFLHDGS